MGNVAERIIFHWTAGGGRASALDKEHYHKMVEFDGTIIDGTEEIADNIVTADDDYAAHTLGMNTKSIGVAVCGMRGAVQDPFDPGPNPITEVAFRALARLGAELCMTYSIPVSDTTTLTHAEVESNLGVKQRGKWDISRLVFRPELRSAKAVGDYLRELIKEAMQGQGVRVLSTPKRVNDRPVLRKGDVGAMVLDLQTQLKAAGYMLGKVDGSFGQNTFNAVTNVQSAAEITMDGIVGPETWDALREMKAPPPRNVTADDLRKRGSTTVQATDAQASVALLGVGGVTLEAARGAMDMAAESKGTLEWVAAFAKENVVLVGVLICLTVGWYLANRIQKERVRKAMESEDLSL
jgi:hypothetical protein